MDTGGKPTFCVMQGAEDFYSTDNGAPMARFGIDAHWVTREVTRENGCHIYASERELASKTRTEDSEQFKKLLGFVKGEIRILRLPLHEIPELIE